MNKPSGIAVILARGGSERLPRKNVMPLNGRPLISYVIQAANESEFIEATLVSTDDKEIQQVAINEGAKAPFLRPDFLSSAEATSLDALVHAVQTFEELESRRFDFVVLVQPTSPFTTGQLLDNAISEFLSTGCESMISVCRPSKKVEWYGKVENNVFTGLKLKGDGNVFVPSGNFYVYKREVLEGITELKEHRAFEVSMEDVIDIDYKIDFEVAELLIQKRQAHQGKE